MERPYKRIGYHSVSDDCVSSMSFPNWEVNLVIEELELNPDIDHIWTRDEDGNVDWEWRKESDSGMEEPETVWAVMRKSSVVHLYRAREDAEKYAAELNKEFGGGVYKVWPLLVY